MPYIKTWTGARHRAGRTCWSILTELACYAALFALPASAQVTLFVTAGWSSRISFSPCSICCRRSRWRSRGSGRCSRERGPTRRRLVSCSIGTGFAVLFAVAASSRRPVVAASALFVYGAASSESRTVALAALLDGLSVDDVASPLVRLSRPTPALRPCRPDVRRPPDELQSHAVVT